MALPREIEAYEATIGQPVGRAAPRLPLLSAVVPVADAFLLALAAFAAWRLSPSAFAFAALAFAVLWLSGSQRMRINPVLSQDLVPILLAVALPAIAIVPFAGHESAQSRRCADVREDANHGHRISRRDDGAEHQAGDERHTGKWREGDADHECRDQHGNHRQEQNGPGIFDDPLHLDRQRALKEECRQKHIEKRV